MGYINFQLQNNSCSIIFQARKKRRKKKNLLFVLFISYWKEKIHFKKEINKGVSGNIAKTDCKEFQLISYSFAFIQMWSVSSMMEY